MSFVSTSVNYADPLGVGLKHCWLINEGGGSGINDIATGNSRGLLTNATTNSWKGGVNGPAILFDGTNDYIVLETDKMNWINSSSFSLSFWVKSNTSWSTNMYPFGRGYIEAAGVHGIHVGLSSTLIDFFRNNGAYRYGRSSWTPSLGYNHIVIVFDKDKLVYRHFHNGQELSVSYPLFVPTAADVTYNATYDAGFNIAAQVRNIANLYSNGYYQDFRIYNRALNENDAKILYNKKFAGLRSTRLIYSPYGAGYSSFTGVSTTTGISSITF